MKGKTITVCRKISGEYIKNFRVVKDVLNRIQKPLIISGGEKPYKLVYI